MALAGGFGPGLLGTSLSSIPGCGLQDLDALWIIDGQAYYPTVTWNTVFFSHYAIGLPDEIVSQAQYGAWFRSGIIKLQDCEQLKRETRHGETLLMIELLKDLWLFMKERKKYWLAPIIVVMVLLGGLLIFAQGSAVAPFIYTLF